jgi:hypothetical protein
MKSEMEIILKVELSKLITAELIKTILQFTIEILGVLLIEKKNCYCHLLQSCHM